jgi:16S rRNA C967 or C1407 C5-methylase (RsmB/RsmF family)/NOL1/NOP2/fmu family ribosome biogenesis protein
MLLPPPFVSQMQTLLGDEYALFNQSMKIPSPTSIRYNPFKKVNRMDGTPLKWCDDAMYLPARPDFSQDPFWHGGAYYVQEAGSVFAAYLVEQLLPNIDKPVVLDLCAAPGGKSTHLATILKEKGLLVSNEVVRARFKILEENLIKWGLPNVVLTQNDPSHFAQLTNFFDVVVVDAPCSGEGLFRKQPEAANEWSEKQVEFCAMRQQRILEDIWPCIRPGGYLVYSTCTYNTLENEANLQWLVKNFDCNPIALEIDEKWNIFSQTHPHFTCYRFYPHKTMSEGFFISVLQKKKEEYRSQHLHIKHPYFQKLSKDETSKIADWFLDTDLLCMKQPNGIVNLLPSIFYPEIEYLAKKLKVLYTGSEVCEIKGRDFNPLQPLANSVFLNQSAFQSVELSLEEALHYLAKNDLSLETSEGTHLAKYAKLPLGWFKKLPQRINNYYPSEWRLRSISKAL